MAASKQLFKRHTNYPIHCMASGMPPHSTNMVYQTGLLINDWDAKLSIGIK